MPTIGVRVHGGMPPKACIEIAEAVERNEFAALWFAENPFNRGILPAAAGAVLATRRIKIGIGVFNPYNRHPTLIAMELGALDEIADGRIALGIGSGIGDRVTRMGLSYEKPLAAVRDAITIVRGMMKGESVTYHGSVFSVTNVKLEFPVPRPNMPIYMAATGDQSLRVCGQVADGLMISNMCPPGYTVRALQLLGEGAVKAGRPTPTTVIQYVPCVIACRAHRGAPSRQGDPWRYAVGLLDNGEKWPAIRAAMLRGSGIPEPEFVAAVSRIKAGEKCGIRIGRPLCRRVLDRRQHRRLPRRDETFWCDRRDGAGRHFRRRPATRRHGQSRRGPERRGMKFQCHINGQAIEADIAPRILLSDFIRHELRLTGTNIGCEMGVCGACTVIVDGEPTRSCLMFAVQTDGCHVETVESLCVGREVVSVAAGVPRTPRATMWLLHARISA